MAILNGKISICCDECEEIYELNASDFDLTDESSDEREMGVEKQFTWKYESECPKCKIEHEIVIEIWEYPVGFVNYKEITSSGCETTDKITIENAHED